MMGVLAWVSSASAQTITTADAVGVVTDTSGGVVPNASVTIKSEESGESRTEKTNSAGQYRFPLLRPGVYAVSATSQGLKSNISRITLLVGEEQEVNITMSAQATTTVVEVTANASILQAENANMETSFNSKQVEALPMPGGDLTTLAMTSTGIRVNVGGTNGVNMNANGIAGASMLFTLNGMDDNDPANNLNNSGASNNLLGANEVSEAAVVLNAYSPQYGRMAGAQVNLIGFSGTNAFHGNVFYNFNYQGLNANSFFNNVENVPRGRSDAHNFGGRIGGPIVKNKLFFFFDDENLRYVLPAAGVVSLPSPQLEAYALAHVPAASLPLYQDMFALVNSSPGIGRAVPVTNGTGPLQDGNGHLGCGTGTFTGTPTGSGGVFGVNTPCAVALGVNNNQINTELLYTIRTDYDISSNQKIFFRFEHDAGVQATGTSPISPLYNQVSIQPQYQGGINHTWVITPAIVNNFVGSVLWYSALFGVQDFSKAASTMPEQLTFADGGANGGGFATVGGGNGSLGIPNGRNVGHVQLNDDISWNKGKHTLKAGFAFRYDKYTYTSIAASTVVGEYNFSDLADFANGKLNSAGANLGSAFTQSFTPYGALHFRVPSVDFYGSDEWAVTKNLKLTYGIRFEENFNPTCVEKCFSLTNAPFNTTGVLGSNNSAYTGGLSVPYNATLSTGSNLFYHAEAPIPEPRLGVAWKPFGHEKTVVRSGIGLFATNYTDGLAGTLGAQVPNKFAPAGLNFGNVGLPTDPTTAAYTAQQSANAFFSGFGTGDTLAALKSAVAPATFSTPSITSLPSTYQVAKSLQWSFEIQQQITPTNLFTVSYVGNHGYDIAETLNGNMYTSAAGVTRYGGAYSGLPTAAPDPRFVTITQYFNNGVSNYNAMTVQYRHTFKYGLTSQLHYTWSHALGTVAYENPFNINTGYGNLSFDSRHQVAGDLVWVEPWKFHNTLVNWVAGGWTVGAKMYLYSGTPFSVTDSKIPSQVNSAGGVITPLADLLTPSAVNANCGGVAESAACLTKSEFATYATTSGAGTAIQSDFGNIAPDSFRGPGYFDIDATLVRDFRLKEKVTFQIGAQAYNLLNHVNFANPSGSISSGSFGTITATVGPPTSIYGSDQGSSVSGRVVVVTGKISF